MDITDFEMTSEGPRQDPRRSITCWNLNGNVYILVRLSPHVEPCKAHIKCHLQTVGADHMSRLPDDPWEPQSSCNIPLKAHQPVFPIHHLIGSCFEASYVLELRLCSMVWILKRTPAQ